MARHGEDYKLSEALTEVALNNILVGNVNDNFELWEPDKMPFEEILRRSKDQARTNKLEHMYRTWKSGINLGFSQASSHKTSQGLDTWGEPAHFPQGGPADPQELNSTKGKGGKGKKEHGMRASPRFMG